MKGKNSSIVFSRMRQKQSDAGVCLYLSFYLCLRQISLRPSEEQADFTLELLSSLMGVVEENQAQALSCWDFHLES